MFYLTISKKSLELEIKRKECSLKKIITIWHIFIIVLEIITFLPIIEAWLTINSIKAGIISSWSVLTLIYLFVGIELDIYFIKFIRHTLLWQSISAEISSFLRWNKPLLDTVAIKFKVKEPSRVERFFHSLGYVGLFLCSTIINFGRLGNTIYAANQERLRLGRWFLYGGCIVRFIINYCGLWQMIKLFL